MDSTVLFITIKVGLYHSEYPVNYITFFPTGC